MRKTFKSTLNEIKALPPRSGGLIVRGDTVRYAVGAEFEKHRKSQKRKDDICRHFSVQANRIRAYALSLALTAGIGHAVMPDARPVQPTAGAEGGPNASAVMLPQWPAPHKSSMDVCRVPSPFER